MFSNGADVSSSMMKYFAPTFSAVREHCDPVDCTGADGDVVALGGAAGGEPGRGALANVLYVKAHPAAGVFVEQSDRITTAVDDPEDVHLVAHVVGIGGADEVVEERLAGSRRGVKLVAVRVVAELDARRTKRGARAVEVDDGLFHVRAGELAVVRIQGHTTNLRPSSFAVATEASSSLVSAS